MASAVCFSIGPFVLGSLDGFLSWHHPGHEKARQGQRGWLSANESKFATSYAQHLAVDSVKLWSSSLSLASPLAVSQAGNKGLGMVWLICSTLCSQTAHRRGGKSCSCSGVSWKCRTRVKCEGDPEHGGIFLGFHGNQGEHGTLKQHTHTHTKWTHRLKQMRPKDPCQTCPKPKHKSAIWCVSCHPEVIWRLQPRPAGTGLLSRPWQLEFSYLERANKKLIT